MIVFIILFVASFAIVAYLVRHIRRMKSSNTTVDVGSVNEGRNISEDIYETPANCDVNNYEQVEIKQPTYADLQKRENEDNFYWHMNKAQNTYINK